MVNIVRIADLAVAILEVVVSNTLEAVGLVTLRTKRALLGAAEALALIEPVAICTLEAFRAGVALYAPIILGIVAITVLARAILKVEPVLALLALRAVLVAHCAVLVHAAPADGRFESVHGRALATRSNRHSQDQDENDAYNRAAA